MDLGLFLNPIVQAGNSVNLIYLILLGILSLAIGYFLGGINCGIIVSRLMYHDDIRNYGSKNAGMTNMIRTYGKKAGAITLIGDILKTVVAILISRLLFGEMGAYLAGLGSVYGHIFPCYFGFKGGKGVSAVAAVVLCTNPLCFVILFAIFVILVAAYKFISLGSVMCMLLYPLLLNRLGEIDLVPIVCAFIIAITVIIKHKDNIKRLLNGTENKFSLKSKKKTRTEESEKSENL